MCNNLSPATNILYENSQYFKNKHAPTKANNPPREEKKRVWVPQRGADLTLVVFERVPLVGSIRVSYSGGLLTHLLLTSLAHTRPLAYLSMSHP